VLAPPQRLLDLDVDLAEELQPETRRVARAAATAEVLELECGSVQLGTWLARTADGPGLLIVDGLLAVSVQVADRVASELLGPGDLLQPLWAVPDELLSPRVTWRVLVAARLAVLDGSFWRRVGFWPELSRALIRRAGRRAVSLDVMRAISSQPRLEVRLALLLWHLAGRWACVGRDGLRLRVPLTHQLLGQLVGAERPSVSHALARLDAAGLVTGHGDAWYLHGSLEERLPTMIEPAGDRAEQILATVAARRPR
jgi:CRP-like cAMP-binding protein